MHRCFNFLACILLVPLFTFGQLTSTYLTIPEIQGPGLESPYDGQELSIPLRGCVTGVAAEGFFLQDPVGDGNARTSDGIYVYRYSKWTNPRGLKTGDLVEITRYRVQEFYGQTEIAGLSDDKTRTYRVLGRCEAPDPVPIEAPGDPRANPVAEYEAKEAQRVIVDLDASVVGPTQRYESRHSAGDPEITLVQRGNPYYGRRIFANELDIGHGTLALSGGLNVDLPQVAVYDRITADDLTGILAYQFGRYVLLVEDPTALRTIHADAQPTVTAPAGEDEWTACTFNTENLFDAIDDGDGDVGDWSPADDAAYRANLARQAVLIRDQLGKCTIVALQEIEGKDKVWADLAAASGPNYRFDYWESMDIRDITVGLLYDATRVVLRRSEPVQACSATDYGVQYQHSRGQRTTTNPCAAGVYPLYDRPPYVADLIVSNARGDRYMEVHAVVVHLKSKRGEETENLSRRVQQAAHVAALLEAPLAMALGDFNDDLGSRPMAQFVKFVNLYERHTRGDDRYSYIYNGRSQAVDHIVLTHDLDRYYRDGGPLHVNADFGEALEPAAGRASDHDPIAVRFLFRPTSITDALIGVASGAYSQLFRLK